MPRAMCAAIAPFRSFMSASISARFWPRSCVARWAKKSAGTMVLPLRALTIGLITYVAAAPHLPLAGAPRANGRATLSVGEARRLAALAALFVPVTLFWAVYEQQGNTIALWADDFTDRRL